MSLQPFKPFAAACDNCAECPHDVAVNCENTHPPNRGFSGITDAEIQALDCPANSWLGSWRLQALPALLLAAFAIVVGSSLAGALGYIAPSAQIAGLALAFVFAMVWALLRDAISSRRAEQKRLATLDRIEGLANAERKALIAKEAADAAAASKTTLVANMSHEIRTPMNGVIGFAQLLLSTRLSSEQRKYAELILESGDSMVALLNDILDIAKIEAGKMTVVPEPTNVRDLVTSSTSMMKAAARQKGLRLTVSIDDQIPRELMLDGLRVRQVLSNLIGNAIKFTEKGAVHVQLKPLPASDETLGEVIELSIADTGIGIAPEWQAVVFDQFVQADGSNRRTHGGTGLGLPISRQLAQLMQGTLTLESREGEGTLVALRIPLVRAPKGEKKQQVALASPERFVRRAGTVLVAEDCDVNLMLMQDMLSNLGFSVITASNGAEAVSLVEQANASGQPVGLILMDMQMPDVDGLEATRRLRAQGFDAAQLPIIALSASAFQGDVKACLDIGMQQHLAKPIGQRDLIEAIDRWLVKVP